MVFLWFSYGFPIVSMICSSHHQPAIHFEPPFCLEKRTNCWITTRRFSEESWRWGSQILPWWHQAIQLSARSRFARKHQRQTWNPTVSQDFFPVPVFVEDRGQHLKPKPEISDMLTFLTPTSWSMWCSFWAIGAVDQPSCGHVPSVSNCKKELLQSTNSSLNVCWNGLAA